MIWPHVTEQKEALQYKILRQMHQTAKLIHTQPLGKDMKTLGKGAKSECLGQNHYGRLQKFKKS